MNQKLFCLAIGSTFLFSACSKGTTSDSVASNPLIPQSAPVVVPASWILPENNATSDVVINPNASPTPENDSAEERALAPHVDRIFNVSRTAVENGLSTSQTTSTNESPHAAPTDWVPWHMEFFTTDLSLTSSGKIGVLTVAGSPWVQAFWRRQNEAPAAASSPGVQHLEAASSDNGQAPITLSLNNSTSQNDLAPQVDTMVRTAMATGKVNDENSLRQNLTNAAVQFNQMVSVLSQADQATSGHDWWVSRYRVDLIVAGSGNLGVLPTTVGGNLRLRFEWQRISPVTPAVTKPPVTASQPIQNSTTAFVLGMKTNLETAAQSADLGNGIFPYQIRVGLGMTVSGTVGLAKGSAELLGHVYFATKVTKPSVHPPVKSADVALIEKSPSQAHLELAAANGIATETSQDDVVYKIDQEKFAAGLKKAMHMGAFFANRAVQPTSSHWKLYQMYVGFDMSVTGTAGAVSVAGNSSDEIDFYNGNF